MGQGGVLARLSHNTVTDLREERCCLVACTRDGRQFADARTWAIMKSVRAADLEYLHVCASIASSPWVNDTVHGVVILVLAVLCSLCWEQYCRNKYCPSQSARSRMHADTWIAFVLLLSSFWIPCCQS